jgi:hypothetical protein
MSDISSLPEGWTEHKTKGGRTYFYNASSKKSSWVRPGPPPVAVENDGSFMEKFMALQRAQAETAAESVPSSSQEKEVPAAETPADSKGAGSTEKPSSSSETSSAEPELLESKRRLEERAESAVTEEPSNMPRPAKSSRFTKPKAEAPSEAATAYLRQVAELKSADPSGGGGGKWLVR